MTGILWATTNLVGLARGFEILVIKLVFFGSVVERAGSVGVNGPATSVRGEEKVRGVTICLAASGAALANGIRVCQSIKHASNCAKNLRAGKLLPTSTICFLISFSLILFPALPAVNLPWLPVVRLIKTFPMADHPHQWPISRCWDCPMLRRQLDY